jgi:hypothetical protein
MARYHMINRYQDEAKAQYQKASTLDLTAADKAELAKVSHG